jgi:hypothetical protein
MRECLDETLQRLANHVTGGSQKTMSKMKLDDMANAIHKMGLKHKINPSRPEKNIEKIIKDLTAEQRETLSTHLHSNEV